MKLSVVIPVFNDAEVLPELVRRLIPVLSALTTDFEVVFVDDGSRDDSVKIIKKMMSDLPKIVLVKLKQNYGQSNAIAAGLTQARGEFVVVMDSDLQDCPEDIPVFLERIINDNIDMVLAQREESGEGWRKMVSVFFYNFSNCLTTIKHPPRTGVFRIIRKSALANILGNPHQPGTFLSRLLFQKSPYSCVKLKRGDRFAGKSGYNLRKLLNLALGRFLVYSKIPLTLAGSVLIVMSLIILGLLLFCSGIWLKSLLILPLYVFLYAANYLLRKDLLEKYVPTFEIDEICSSRVPDDE
ncbi:MAG: glycosyltransferase family 2 protein [Candidatus Cloacimonetes bacterium]|nr:glycosyltransferase family 2 protein [Candidatus Cloacimonadota bacterium]